MDKARKKTDKRLKTLENKIKKTFRDAAKELTETIETYFSEFEEADEKQKKRLSDGKITENQYKLWRINKIATGNRYKALGDKLANRMTQAGEIAMSYINDTMPFAYSINREWQKNDIVKQGGKILKGIDFTLFDEATAKRLITKNPDLMPNYPKAKAIKRGIDLAYGRKQITKIITSSILQGKSIPNIAKDLIKSLPAMSMQSAIRTARTAITEAENAGRQDAADELEKKGVILKKEWIATPGKRTRKWHADADGQRVDNDKPFIVGGEKLMYPGDKSKGASGKNIYNCRCSSKRVVVGFKSILTEEQKKENKEGEVMARQTFSSHGFVFEFEDNSGEILKAFENASRRGLEAIGETAEGYAKRDCPVDTGRLRNSITNQVKGDDVYIGSNTSYAPYVQHTLN